MNAVGMLLVLIPIFIVIGSIIILTMIRKRPSHGRRHKYIKKFRIIYTVILIISAVMFCSLKIIYTNHTFKNNPIDIKYAEKLDSQIFNMLGSESCTLNDLKNFNKIESSKFKYSSNKLMISVPDDYFVVIEKSASVKKEIYMEVYRTDLIYGGMNVTKYMKVPVVNISNERLEASSPASEIKIKTFRKDLILRQFSDSEYIDDYNDSRRIGGRTIVFVKLPENMDLVCDKPVIHVKDSNLN